MSFDSEDCKLLLCSVACLLLCLSVRRPKDGFCNVAPEEYILSKFSREKICKLAVSCYRYLHHHKFVVGFQLESNKEWKLKCPHTHEK